VRPALGFFRFGLAGLFYPSPPKNHHSKNHITMPKNSNSQHSEGPIAKAIEKQTAKLPSDIFLWAALGSMAISLGFKLFKKNNNALFVGDWAAPFLLLGLYNKLVKLEGHSGSEEGEEDNSSWRASAREVRNAVGA